MENQGTEPALVDHWSWGAFMNAFNWGIGNRVYLTLWILVPIFNLVWVFIVGAKAHRWAWEKNSYQNEAEYNAIMATWDRAGFVQFILFLAAIVLNILFIIFLGALGAVLFNSN